MDINKKYWAPFYANDAISVKKLDVKIKWKIEDEVKILGDQEYNSWCGSNIEDIARSIRIN